jgi:hypothetical protein
MNTSELIENINETRLSYMPKPKDPINEKDLQPVLEAGKKLIEELKKLFGCDKRIIVMGNGNSIFNE